MKVIKKVLPIVLAALWLVVICLPQRSFAAGGGFVSDDYLEIALGDTGYISIGTDNAAGTYSISASGSVWANDSGWLDNDSATIGIYGASEGDGQVSVTFTDLATYDDEDLSGTSFTINVHVYAPDDGYTGDYGKSGDDGSEGYDYNDVTQVSDKLNIWLEEEPYSVLTDLSGVEIPKGFTAADGTFEGESVKTINYGSDIVLYALWNHWNGAVIFRTYDPASKTFGLPASFTQGDRTYYLLKFPAGTEIPEGYIRTELSLNGSKTEALVSERKEFEDFYYIYAMTDGESGFYSYDKKEGSLQRAAKIAERNAAEEEPAGEKTAEEKPADEKTVSKTEKFLSKLDPLINRKTFIIGGLGAVVIIIVLIILLIISHKKYRDLFDDDFDMYD